MKIARIFALIPALLIAVAVLQFAPASALAAQHCIGIFNICFNDNGKAYIEPQADPVPILDTTPAPSVAALNEGTPGTAKLCSGVGETSTCRVVTVDEATKSLQSLLDAANNEAGTSASCQGGDVWDYQDDCGTLPPPTVTYDSQGRITYVGCGNGAVQSVTYYDPTPTTTCSEKKDTACTSSGNSCGMTAAGTVQCDGSCSASVPAESLCPASGTGGTHDTAATTTATSTTTTTVTTLPVNPSPDSVSVRLFADPLSIVYGLFSTLTWSSSHAVSCTGAPADFAQGKTGDVDGVKVSPLETTRYQLDCKDASGNEVSDYQTVSVSEPVLAISASPSIVRSGDQTSISWSGGAGSCTLSGTNGFVSHELASPDGGVPQSISAETTFTFSCVAGSFSPSKSIVIKIAPNFKEF